MVQISFATTFKFSEISQIWLYFVINWHKIEKIRFDILKVQNLLPVSHKLKSNLANFRKFKCCRERNLDHFHFLQFWYLETSFGKSNYIFRKKKEFCFCDFLLSFMSFWRFLTENVDPISPILNFFMKIKVKISKNLKIGDIGSIFSVKKVDNGMKPVVHHIDRIISCF